MAPYIAVLSSPHKTSAVFRATSTAIAAASHPTKAAAAASAPVTFAKEETAATAPRLAAAAAALEAAPATETAAAAGSAAAGAAAPAATGAAGTAVVAAAIAAGGAAAGVAGSGGKLQSKTVCVPVTKELRETSTAAAGQGIAEVSEGYMFCSSLYGGRWSPSLPGTPLLSIRNAGLGLYAAPQSSVLYEKGSSYSGVCVRSSGCGAGEHGICSPNNSSSSDSHGSVSNSSTGGFCINCCSKEGAVRVELRTGDIGSSSSLLTYSPLAPFDVDGKNVTGERKAHEGRPCRRGGCSSSRSCSTDEDSAGAHLDLREKIQQGRHRGGAAAAALCQQSYMPLPEANRLPLQRALQQQLQRKPGKSLLLKLREETTASEGSAQQQRAMERRRNRQKRLPQQWQQQHSAPHIVHRRMREEEEEREEEEGEGKREEEEKEEQILSCQLYQQTRLQERKKYREDREKEDKQKRREEDALDGREEVQQAYGRDILFPEKEEVVKQISILESPFGRRCELRSNGLAWPLQPQHALVEVEVIGSSSYFQEAAAHRREKTLVDEAQRSHIVQQQQRQRQQTACLTPTRSLLPAEVAIFGEAGPSAAGASAAEAAATNIKGTVDGGAGGGGGQEEASFLEELQEGEESLSLSMMLRPNVLNSWRFHSTSSTGVGGSPAVLRSVRSTGSLRRSSAATDAGVLERGEAETAAAVAAKEEERGRALPAERIGKSHAKEEDTGSLVEVEEGGGRDELHVVGAFAPRTSSKAATDVGSVALYTASALSSCCFWTKRIIFSRTRWHYLLFLCIYSYLVGPVYLNWAPLRELFFRSGAYAWECDPYETDPNSLRYISKGKGGQEGGGRGDSSSSGSSGRSSAACTLQRLRVGNLYTVCAATDFGFSFFGGLVVDWLGPKTGSLLGSTSMLAGWLLLALSSEETPTYIPGVVLFGIGIDMAFYGTMTVAHLFPGHGNTVIAALAGMRGLGLMSPLILNLLPLSFTAVMLGYALLGLLPAVLIASVYAPWKPFHSNYLMTKKKTRKGGNGRGRGGKGGSFASSRKGSSASGIFAAEPAADSSRDHTRIPQIAVYNQIKSSEKEEEEQLHQEASQETQQEQQEEIKKQHRTRQPEEEERLQQPTVMAAVAGPGGVSAVEREEQERSFCDSTAEEKSWLLQRSDCKAVEKNGSPLDFVCGVEGEEAQEREWRSGVQQNSEKQRGEWEFSSVPLVQQKPQQMSALVGKKSFREQEHYKHAEKQQEEKLSVSAKGGDEETGRGRTREATCWTSKSSGAVVAGDSSTDPALPSIKLEMLSNPVIIGLASSSSSSSTPAQKAADAAALETGAKAGLSAVAAASGMVASSAKGNLDDCSVRLEKDESEKSGGAAVAAGRGGRQVATQLGQQQQQQRTEPTSPQMGQQGKTSSSISRGLPALRHPAAFRSDVGGDSGGRYFPPHAAISRRTVSTAGDEESIETCGTACVKAQEERKQPLELRQQHQEERLVRSVGEEVNTAAATAEEKSHNCASAAAQSPTITQAAAPRRRGRCTTATSVILELSSAVANPNEDPTTGRGAAGAAVHEQQKQMLAEPLKQGRERLRMRRRISSRQFPHTVGGRIRYTWLYIQQHPWSVSAVAFVKDYMCTLAYLPVVPYFALSLIRSVYFSDASEDLVPKTMMLLHVLLANIFLVPPLAGLLADLWTIIPCLVLVNTTGTLVVVGALLAHLTHAVAFQYIATISYMPYAALLTNQVYFYVADSFPQRHLGKLCGFACSIGGVASLCVTSMFEFSVKTEGGFTIILGALLAISVLCYSLLVLLYIAQQRIKRQQAKAAASAAAAVDAVDAEAAAEAATGTSPQAAAPLDSTELAAAATLAIVSHEGVESPPFATEKEDPETADFARENRMATADEDWAVAVEEERPEAAETAAAARRRAASQELTVTTKSYMPTMLPR